MLHVTYLEAAIFGVGVGSTATGCLLASSSSLPPTPPPPKRLRLSEANNRAVAAVAVAVAVLLVDAARGMLDVVLFVGSAMHRALACAAAALVLHVIRLELGMHDT